MARYDLVVQDDQRLLGLAAFERWSNYLLITTVAAVGWTVTNPGSFDKEYLQALTVWSLGLSAICGIFTLALIPLLAEQIREEHRSIFRVPIEVTVLKFGLRVYVAQACRPQHITFISGVTLYCIGTVGHSPLALLTVVAVMAVVIMSKPRGRWRDRTHGQD